MESNQRLALSVPELQKKLGIGRDKAYELTRREGFPAIRIGKRIIIPVEALEAWLLKAGEL